MWKNYIWLLNFLTVLSFGIAKIITKVDIRIRWNNFSHMESEPSGMYVAEKFENSTLKTWKKSQEQCKMYLKWLKTPNGNNLKKCKSLVKMEIIKKTKASPQEFPHMAQLYYGDINQPTFECGANLISEQFLLTAAHCIFGNTGPPIGAKLGYGQPGSEVTVQIIRYIPYPEYNPLTKHNDISLLRLEKPVEFTSYIRPACLHSEKYITEKAAIATGWGYTSHRGPISPHLLKVTLPIMTYSECSQIYEDVDENSMICAGNDRSTQNTCKGDSGGPLQIQKGCMFDIIGVVSVGSKNCSRGTVFTRVSYYIPWIESVVWPEN